MASSQARSASSPVTARLAQRWTGEGELEFSYYVTGPWFQAVNQSNPQLVPLNNGLPVHQTFYRVRSY